MKFAVQMGGAKLSLYCRGGWIHTVSHFDYKALNLWRFFVSAYKFGVLRGQYSVTGLSCFALCIAVRTNKLELLKKCNCD